MINAPQPIIKPEYYTQPPEGKPFDRDMHGKEENVSYLGSTQMRIWMSKEVSGFATHWHSALEIIMPIENSFTVVVEGKTYQLNVGDILIVPPRANHWLKPCKSGVRMIYLFDESMLFNPVFNFVRPLFKSVQLITERSAPEIHDTAYRLFLEMGNTYFEFGELRELMITSLFFKFVTVFSSYNLPTLRSFEDLTKKRKQLHYDKFNEIVKYINENFQEDLTLEDMADRANLSRYHFARLFKEYTNFTFLEFLTRRRISEAGTLLTEGKLSITDVALQSGFPSISSFNRNFKKYLKRTPMEYKKGSVGQAVPAL